MMMTVAIQPVRELLGDPGGFDTDTSWNHRVVAN